MPTRRATGRLVVVVVGAGADTVAALNAPDEVDGAATPAADGWLVLPEANPTATRSAEPTRSAAVTHHLGTR
jgi:hypothetical protein